MPIKNVKNGVMEFNIPASALSIRDWAVVKSKAGIPVPIKPTSNKGFSVFRVTLLKFLMDRGSNNRNEKNILKAATW